MILTFILAAINICWAGFILGGIIAPGDPDAVWIDWLKCLFSVFMGIYFMLAMIVQASSL